MEQENELKVQLQEELPDILEPIAVITSEVSAPAEEQEIPQGYVLITALNEDGTEKENSTFFYPEKNYKRFYGDEAKFLVRKKSITNNIINNENLSRTSQQITFRVTGRCSSCGK